MALLSTHMHTHTYTHKQYSTYLHQSAFSKCPWIMKVVQILFMVFIISSGIINPMSLIIYYCVCQIQRVQKDFPVHCTAMHGCHINYVDIASQIMAASDWPCLFAPQVFSFVYHITAFLQNNNYTISYIKDLYGWLAS